MTEQGTISAQEMAQRLGVTTQTVYNYIEKGLIRGTRQRRGLRSRYVVLRADFDTALPQLLAMGDVAGGGTIGDESQQPRTEALAA